MKTTRNAIALIAIAALSPQIAHAETTTYYHMDALGSPVAATDASGNILWREEYAPYGDRIRIREIIRVDYSGRTKPTVCQIKTNTPETGRTRALESIFDPKNAT